MATTAPPDQATREQLLDWYRTMRTIREFEERLHKEFATGEIPGFVHLYAGEEAIAVGVCAHLRPDDYITSTHRGHGHCIAKGCDMHGMMAEIYGKRDGLCQGKGGSMHIADVDKGMLGANGIVGGGPPCLRRGLTAKIRGTDQVAVSFFGDGASNQGTFHEGLNLAALWNLPCIFVFENNGYAESTSTASTPPGDIANRAGGFDIPGVVVDGHDFFAVYEAAGEAIARARAGGGPTLLECKIYRFYGHFQGDQLTYRAPGRGRRAAPHPRLPGGLRRPGDRRPARSSADDLDAIDAEVQALIDDAVAEAKAAPEPDARRPADRRLRQVLRRVDDGARRSRSSRRSTRPSTRRWPATPRSSCSARTSPAAQAAGGELDAWGGAMGVTKGLFQKFPGRVLDTPITESAFIGAAVGAAARACARWPS